MKGTAMSEDAKERLESLIRGMGLPSREQEMLLSGAEKMSDDEVAEVAQGLDAGLQRIERVLARVKARKEGGND